MGSNKSKQQAKQMEQEGLLHINEYLNAKGPNRCFGNDECDGRRTCSSAGWC